MTVEINGTPYRFIIINGDDEEQTMKTKKRRKKKYSNSFDGDSGSHVEHTFHPQQPSQQTEFAFARSRWDGVESNARVLSTTKKRIERSTTLVEVSFTAHFIHEKLNIIVCGHHAWAGVRRMQMRICVRLKLMTKYSSYFLRLGTTGMSGLTNIVGPWRIEMRLYRTNKNV